MSCSFTTGMTCSSGIRITFQSTISIRVCRIYDRVDGLSTVARVIFKRGPNQTSGKHRSKKTWLKKPGDVRFTSGVRFPREIRDALRSRSQHLAGGHSSRPQEEVYRSFSSTPYSTRIDRDIAVLRNATGKRVSKTISRTRVGLTGETGLTPRLFFVHFLRVSRHVKEQ